MFLLLKTQSLIAIKSRKRKRERETQRIDRDHMTDRKRRQNLAKCCSVAKLNESMKLPRRERTSTRFGKNLPIMGSEMWYVFGFSSKIVVIVIQSGLKLYDLTVIAAGVQANEFVMRRSIRKFNIPPRATPRAFELLKIGLFKFPPLGAKRPFKCPTN